MEIQYMMEICMSTRQRVIEDFMAGIRFELGPKEKASKDIDQGRAF